MQTKNVSPFRRVRPHHCEFPAPLFFDSLDNPCWTEEDREDGFWMPIRPAPVWLICECFLTEAAMPLAA